MGGGKNVFGVLQQYQASRAQFAQSVADLASRPEAIESLLQEDVLTLLKNLLSDNSPGIQRNAAVAIGKLAGQSPAIAEMIIQQNVLSELLCRNANQPNRYLKRAALITLRAIVKHTPELSRSVIEMGGLNLAVISLEEFDTAVKEAAMFVVGYIARHNSSLALETISAGVVPQLVLCLQEPDTNTRVVAASALSDIAKHTVETAQPVLDAGAVALLVRATGSPDIRLKRQSLNALACIAKHTMDMAESVIEGEIFPLVLEQAGHPDELVRKASCSLIKEIVKHSPELAQMVVEAGGLGVVVSSIVKNKGENRMPGILGLGFIAGHNSALSLSVIYSKGIEALSITLDDELQTHVGAAAAWALGHIAKHSSEHAKHVSSSGLLPKILQLYNSSSSTEDMKEKAKQALKMILLRTEDLASIDPMLSTAPPEILKYVVVQYSKLLPRSAAARRSFVTSGGLRKIQELLASTSSDDNIIKEHVDIINSCFPPDIINYFSPDYPQIMLDRVEQYNPNITTDMSDWSEKLMEDTKIPVDIKKEMNNMADSINQSRLVTNKRSISKVKTLADMKKSTISNAGDGLRKSKKSLLLK